MPCHSWSSPCGQYEENPACSSQGDVYKRQINSFCLSVINTCAKEKYINVQKLVPTNESIVRAIAAKMLPEYPSDSQVRSLAPVSYTHLWAVLHGAGTRGTRRRPKRRVCSPTTAVANLSLIHISLSVFYILDF